MSDSPNPEFAALREEFEGMKRRLRLIETGGQSRPGGPSLPQPAAGRDWLEYARYNAWSFVYLFIGLVDLIFGMRMKDPILICGAAAMMAFAWLSWRGEP